MRIMTVEERKQIEYEVTEIMKSATSSEYARYISLILCNLIEEVQQYRAIGLTPELIEAMQGHNVALINDLGEYQAIGTVEEFKAYKQGNCTNDCKHYDSAIEYVRNKAIDEFAERLKDLIAKNVEDAENSNDLCCEIFQSEIDEIAEQLKAGGKNE